MIGRVKFKRLSDLHGCQKLLELILRYVICCFSGCGTFRVFFLFFVFL